MMIRTLTRRMKNKKGFTLVELIVVVAILGILAAVAVPRLGGFRSQAEKVAVDANKKTLKNIAVMYLTENGKPEKTIEWSKTSTNREWEDYLNEWPGEEYIVKITTEGEITVELSDKSDSD